MNTAKSISILCLLATTLSIVIQVPAGAYKKCLYAQFSPDKTLQARLGFQSKGASICQVSFNVNIVSQDLTTVHEHIYSGMHFCQKMRQRQPYVVKHTSHHTQYQGKYEICIDFEQNNNPDLLVDLFIGQRLNPIMYDESDVSLPLVQSHQMVQLDLTVQSIKRSMVRTRQFAKQSRQEGDVLDVKIEELMSKNKVTTLLQILCLVVFGLVWMRMASMLKRNK